MWIEGIDGDARALDAGAAHHRIGQGDGFADTLRRDLVEGFAQRDMAGHARHPLPVEHVHFAEVALVAKQVGEHLVLVGEAPAAVEHRPLVQGSEGDGVDLASPRHLDSAGESIAGELAGLGGDLSALEAGRIDVAEIDQRHRAG